MGRTGASQLLSWISAVRLGDKESLRAISTPYLLVLELGDLCDIHDGTDGCCNEGPALLQRSSS